MLNKKKPVQVLLETNYLEMRKDKKIKEISIIDLCKQANVSHSSFYKYYQDIYDLNQKIEDQEMITILKKLDHTIPDSSYRFVESIIDFVLKKLSIYKKDELYILFNNISILINKLFDAKPEYYLGENKQILAESLIIYLVTLIAKMINNGKKKFFEEDISFLAKTWDEIVHFGLHMLYPDKNDEQISALREIQAKRFVINMNDYNC